MPGTFFLYPQQIIDSPGQQFVLNNAAVTTDGYQVISGFGSNELVLIINIKNVPTGTLPTLTFTMQEVDPIDQTTAIGSPVISAALNGVGTTILTKLDAAVGTVKVSWHIGGTGVPVFTGVNVTVLQRVAGSSVEITDGTNTAAVKPASTPAAVTDPALVVAMSPNSTIATSSPVDTTVTGSLGALNATATVATNGCSHASLVVSGTWSGTIFFEASIDGVNYFEVSAQAIVDTEGTRESNVATFGADFTTTNGQWILNAHGYGTIRVRMATYFSGSASIFLRSTTGDGPDDVQLIMPSDSSAIDAQSRWRVSNPETIFASKQLYDNQSLFWDDQQISGAGTSSTFLTNQAASQLNVTLNTPGVRVRQTFRRFNYQTGKSQFVSMSGVLVAEGGVGSAQSNRKIGMFDGYNGLFFGMNGTTLGVAVRTNTSGTPATNFISQSNWNLDTLDGTGGQNNATGIKIDVSKSQLFVIDFQWGGAGRVRFGFYINGRIIYCHQLLNANLSTQVYMSIPNLPIRYEIESVGGGAATTASLIHMSSSVTTEGGQAEVGYPLAVDRGTTSLTTGADTNMYALLVIQLQPGKTYSTIFPQLLNIASISGGSGSFLYGLLLNPTISGSLSYTTLANSAVQYAIPSSSNTITPGTGTKLASAFDFVNKAVSTPSAFLQLATELTIGVSIAGVSDTIVIFAQPTTANAVTFWCSLDWQELA